MIQFDDRGPGHLQYLTSELCHNSSLAATHTSEPSAVHKIADRLDLVTSRELNKRKQVNTFDIERLSIRKFDMHKELFFQKGNGCFGRASLQKGWESTHVNPGFSWGLYGVINSHLYSNRAEETSVSSVQFSRIAWREAGGWEATSDGRGHNNTVVQYCTVPEGVSLPAVRIGPEGTRCLPVWSSEEH
jgi:hypothetical protein